MQTLVRKYQPGILVRINVTICEGANEGPPCHYCGQGEIRHYETQITDHGLYLNAVIYIPGIQRTVKRSLPYLHKNAEVDAASVTEQTTLSSETIVERYERLQHWYHVLSRRLNKIWGDMLHSTNELPPKAAKVSLTPGIKRKLMLHVLGYLEQSAIQRNELTDVNIREAIRSAAGYVL